MPEEVLVVEVLVDLQEEVLVADSVAVLAAAVSAVAEQVEVGNLLYCHFQKIMSIKKHLEIGVFYLVYKIFISV